MANVVTSGQFTTFAYGIEQKPHSECENYQFAMHRPGQKCEQHGPRDPTRPTPICGNSPPRHPAPQVARHLLTRNCQSYFLGVLTLHPDQCLQGFYECAVCLNHHESARKRPNSIRLQYHICLSLSRTPPPQIQLAGPQELFPVRVPVLVMGLASNQGQVPCPTRERSPHECLVVSDLKPEPRAGDGARCWLQI